MEGAGDLSAEAWTALAQAAGAGIVQAAGTDVWVSVRRRAAGVFGRGDAGHRRTALERLDRTAAALQTDGGRESSRGDPREDSREDSRGYSRGEAVRQEAAWQARFETLLEHLEDDAERERAVTELRALVAEAGRAQAGPGAGAVVGNTFGGPTAFQAGSGNRQFNRFGS